MTGQAAGPCQMRITVDRGKCCRHGQCVIAAPELFRFNDAGELAHQLVVADAQRPAAEDAADVCPEQAITLTF